MTEIIAEVDAIELAVRIAEVCCRTKRLLGQTAQESMRQIAEADPKAADDFKRAARVALEYIAEKIREKGVAASVIGTEPRTGALQ